MTLIETETLDQLLDPLGESMTPEWAQRVVSLRANPAAQARLESLAGRNAEGRLSEQEREEYTALVQAGALISLLQAKARKVLTSPGAP